MEVDKASSTRSVLFLSHFSRRPAGKICEEEYPLEEQVEETTF
jgi:hypothetical protein